MELWPASKITAQVHVMNGAEKPGPGSTPPLEFETPEGPPGPVSNLRIPEKGSSHVKVEWDPPAEPNGNITGYKVFYKPGKVGSNCYSPLLRNKIKFVTTIIIIIIICCVLQRMVTSGRNCLLKIPINSR